MLAEIERLKKGNTPTSVGKTLLRQQRANESRKHPHERGEDFPLALSLTIWAETPPRAWGRPDEMKLAFVLA